MASTIEKININDIEVPIIFEKNNQLPIFNLQLVFKNSGYITDEDKSGITNILAKTLNEGTLKDGAIKFAKKLESKAISINTSTGFETFVIEVSSLKSEAKDAIKYLSKLLNNPNFSDETLKKLKKLHLSKLTQKENDFDYIAQINLKKLVFKDTALENSSSGTIELVEKLNIDDIKTHYEKLLNLKNLIIVAGGDISLGEIKKDIKPIISKFNKLSVKKYKKIKLVNDKKTSTVIKETEQSYIYFASPFNIDSNSTDAYKLKIASFILGGSGFGSRLMEEIRVKRGLAYSAYGYVKNEKTHSYFMGYLQTKLENTNEAKKLVQELVNEFVKEGVTKDELEAAKNFLQGSEPLRSETFSQRQNLAFNLYYKDLNQDYPKQELDKIAKLTLEELNFFIQSHTEIKDLAFSIVTK